MSKTHEKNPPGPQAASDAGAGELALVQSSAPTKGTGQPADPNQGRGGLYTNAAGVRKRVGGTKAAPTQPKKAKD